MAVQYGSLPFREQIEFLREKVALPTRAWTDVYGREHDHAFVVAGANRMAIVEDFQRSIQRMVEEGRTLADFRKDFDAIVERHGWAYKGKRGWRSRVIYETNLLQSYHAGREAQMADPELRRQRPYGLYRHGGSEDPRPEHLAHDGRVVPLDDPWWETWSPKNGWGCKCKKYAISAEEARRRGLEVSEQGPEIDWEEKTVGQNGPSPRTVRVPKGIDPGFEHRPGASRIRGVTPPQLDEPLRSEPERLFPPRRARDELPAPRAYQGELLEEGLDPEAYVRSFLSSFGADLERPAVYRDALGEPLMLSEALFRNARGRWKVLKRGRERYLPMLAQAIRDPDEIWVAAEWHGAAARPVVRRRYVARFRVPGRDQPGVAVFEWGRDGWSGVTTFQSEGEQDDADVEAFRRGVRLYRRGPE
ncbi:PBECR2 nuclease fold domain-containing protein [Spiribacter halobius]|uniref:Phage head morphogenesis domain-containing protein n=1 Tax=Sediminicurvatus halobius TaxID=2182432 RepID=A0A2U2N1I8_9GAMM|nr:PBECR2 nuclease fold domain-containing protein [Spiribacter halobius]PWG62849.1 hypothetical protein DEM34_10810 [Spiribacter halobius]UEX77000.1 hypothetical protein LMH63_13740 [Spiribacter halobius]